MQRGGGVQSGGGPHPRPVRGRCVTHTFINLADSYTPTVRRSWHCAATSSSSTAALTVCILGSGEKEGQRSAGPATDRSGPRPARLTSGGHSPGYLLLRRVVARHELFQRHVAVIIHSGKQPRQSRARKRKIRGRKAQNLPTEPARSFETFGRQRNPPPEKGAKKAKSSARVIRTAARKRIASAASAI